VGLALFALAVAALVGGALTDWSSYRPSNAEPPEYASGPPDDGSELPALESDALKTAASGRPVFRYSVLPSGAYSVGELADAIERDPVVRREYGGLTRHTLTRRMVAAPRMAYVSYRIGDRVYWTKHKVQLKAGEQILTDGVTEIRARCGNCISLQPLQPTSNDEPDLAQLDRLEPESGNPSQTAALPPVGGRGVPPGMLPIFPPGAGVPGMESSNIGAPPGALGSGPFGGVPTAGLTNPLSTRPVSPQGLPPEPGTPGDAVPPISPPGPPTFGPPGGDQPPSGNEPPGGGTTPPGGGTTPPGGSTTPPGGGTPPGGENPPPHDEPPPANVPEPGLFLLLGGGVATWLVRRAWSH